jgi:hypothetical protein
MDEAMSESSTPQRAAVTRTTTGSMKWPSLGIRRPEEQRAALVAEVNAAKARGERESLQELCGRIFDEWLLTREPLSDYARELHEKHRADAS